MFSAPVQLKLVSHVDPLPSPNNELFTAMATAWKKKAHMFFHREDPNKVSCCHLSERGNLISSVL